MLCVYVHCCPVYLWDVSEKSMCNQFWQVLLILPSHIRIAETNYPNIYLDLSHFLQEVRFELLMAIRTLRSPSDVRKCNLLQGYKCFVSNEYCSVYLSLNWESWFLRNLGTNPRFCYLSYLKRHLSWSCTVSKHYERFLLRFSTFKLLISLPAANLCCTAGLVNEHYRRQRRNKAITMKRNCLPIFIE